MASSRRDRDRREARLRAAICKYIRECPDGADTLEGIARWWIPRRYRHVPREMLQRVLEGLVAQGYLRRSALPGKPNLYGAVQVNATTGPAGVSTNGNGVNGIRRR